MAMPGTMPDGRSTAVGAAAGDAQEAAEFVRFCYRRRRVSWPELYDDMCAVAHHGALVHGQRIGFDQPQPLGMLGFDLGERGEAATVAFDSDHLGAGIEKRAGEAAGAGSDFVDILAIERARDRRNARKQLTIENEILAERLARLKSVPRDDLAKRLGRGTHALAARW